MTRSLYSSSFILAGEGAAIPAPDFIEEMVGESEAWLWALGQLAVAIVIALIAHFALFLIAKRITRRTATDIDEIFVDRVRKPALLIFPLLATQLTVSSMEVLSPDEMGVVRHVLSLAAIAGVVWALLAFLSGIEDLVKKKNRIDVADNYQARRAHTQITVIERTLAVVIVIVGIAVALMTFPRVRDLGASILASAGIAGIVIGFAARPVLENLIAGMQIALTQPINIDDVVIVEDEWGWIEQITTTYVVVRIWDQRRLIVPFSKFISEPFQNWTRRTADILGTVFIYADYTVPVQAVRDELQRLVKQSDKWDGRVCVLQVTDATERTVQLRALVSAANSPSAWDLRVWLREKLIEFLQREHPECLPRTRVELRERRGDAVAEEERAFASTDAGRPESGRSG
ncbi:MAG: mechanosensitive ion channel family protein [Phycisphaerales bacterium]